MSPVSRSRKGKKAKKSATRPTLISSLATPEPCDCPACSGEDVDLSGMVDDLLDAASELVDSVDPLTVEMAAAAFVAMCELAGEGFDAALADGFVPEFEASASIAALTMLLAIGSVADGRGGTAAAAAADRLAGAGVPVPEWAVELSEPVKPGDCWRLVDKQGTGSMLFCSLHRAARAHAFMVSVDHTHCDAATNIMLLDPEDLSGALEMAEAHGRDAGLDLIKERVDPAELRWLVESALDARKVHDDQDQRLELVDDDDDDAPEYRALAVLVRARMRALPESDKPKASHGGAVAPSSRVPRLLRGSAGAVRRGERPVPVRRRSTRSR